MAGPRTRKGPRSERTAKLLEALELASYAQETGGNVYETHVRFIGNMLIATNGHLNIGIKVEDDFGANPHSVDLAKALKRTGETTVFTVVDKSRLHLKSGNFSVYVPCVADEWIPYNPPDRPCAKIDNRLLDAMIVCTAATDVKADNPIFRGVWLDGYSVAASDRHSIFQVWHGIHLPAGLIIPVDTIKALAEKGGTLTEFGFSNQSVTFYFDDGTYMRSALYEGNYPNYAALLDKPSNQRSIPADFFQGLRSIVDFSIDGTVYFVDGALTTHSADGKGARYEVPGIAPGLIFNGTRLLALEKYAKSVDFYAPTGAIFAGDMMRGAVAKRAS